MLGLKLNHVSKRGHWCNNSSSVDVYWVVNIKSFIAGFINNVTNIFTSDRCAIVVDTKVIDICLDALIMKTLYIEGTRSWSVRWQISTMAFKWIIQERVHFAVPSHILPCLGNIVMQYRIKNNGSKTFRVYKRKEYRWLQSAELSWIISVLLIVTA